MNVTLTENIRNTIDTIIKYFAGKQDVLEVENNKSARIYFEVGSRRKYFDLLPLYQARDRMVLQNLGGNYIGWTGSY